MGGATDDEPTAIYHAMRYPGHSVWHLPHLLGEGVVIQHCWGPGRGEPTFCALTDTAPADRCRTCWPTPKETP